MKRVPLKQLKQELSRWAEIAAQGETVEITKHNRPFIRLIPATGFHLFVGANVGHPTIRPIVKKGLRGMALKVLLEDREDR